MMMYACQPPARERQWQEDCYKYEVSLGNIVKLYGKDTYKQPGADKMA